MTPIKDFTSLVSHLGSLESRKRIAVVCASDRNTEEAIHRALNEGFADALMIGPDDILDRFPSLRNFGDRVKVIPADDPDDAARKAVAAVRSGEADVLMKGLINTDNLLRAILDKENGLLPQGKVLSHITAASIPSYSKMLFFTDAAVIPFPSFEQRVAMVGYVADACRSFGVERPDIALIHCNEKIHPRFPVTLDYEKITRMASEGYFGDAVVAGPLDVKTACDSSAAAIKGIDSPVVGMSDALVFPDIEAANVFYKTITLFSGAVTAGVLCGTSAPVVIPSRSDSAESKFCALAVACLISGR